MLDLDSLAEQRATDVKESVDKWRRSLWSPLFQTVSQNMSDGDVERLLRSCPTNGHLEAVLNFLQPDAKNPQPLSVLEEAATRAGVGLEAWIRALC